MDESLTLSKEAPLQKSMNYSLLREEGLKYIQKVAGKVWTDYNTHDPGITILEILCYALTDLGYRTSYEVQDIIAQDPNDPATKDIANFFTAGQVLPNGPVTKNDYRKLMIDVEVHNPGDTGCEYAGVKNAWIEKAPGQEVDVYVDRQESRLAYDPAVSGQLPLDLKILHNVLLEFDKCDRYGDLNENKIVKDFTLLEHTPEPELEGLVARVDVEFPRWDNMAMDWEEDSSIRAGIIGVEIVFINLGDNYSITSSLSPGREVVLEGTKTTASGLEPIDGLDEIILKINQFIYDGEESLMAFYKGKVSKINEIVGKVKATLHAHRNLCEDFFQFNALRIEEILLCADIELELDTDVEQAQAQIYHEIAKFLSPTVYFYSLDEMFTRCYEQDQYDIISINTADRVFTIHASFAEPPEPDSIITITGSNNNDGRYTISAVKTDELNEGHTDIQVKEAIPSDIVGEGEKLTLGDVQNVKCIPTEKVFEGPKPRHGFIDNKELEQADRKKVIHVSDLVQMIMDVEGVLAVKNIQIANVPQGNDGSIPSKSVKWCLSLAFDQNYVPRLNTDDSRVTFYKDQLPFKAKQLEVDALLEELGDAERPQKIRYPVMDLKPPRGEYKDIEDYYSIQNEFPLVYGIGEEGLPPAGANKPSQAQARQLKGFLMFFDQLLANYLSQLAHVKDLFSMNAEKDPFGDFMIGRTYYTQPLFDIVPDVDPLYTDRSGHEVALNDIAESTELFGKRRNKFLDHLMARFAEQFTDYALLTYRLSGPKAPTELIEDKLAFLNRYPMISARRGEGLDYKDPCHLWHINNVSGLERRASLLLGIEERKPSTLQFSPRFKVIGTEPNLAFTIENDVPGDILESVKSYTSTGQVKEVLEKVVLNGVFKEKYTIKSDNDVDYYIELVCDNQVLAQSVKKDFTSVEVGGDADLAIDEMVELLSKEFFENPQSNRHNLACPLLNYFDYSISIDMQANPPSYTIDYELFEQPFTFLPGDRVLAGSSTGEGDAKRQTNVLNIDTGNSTFTVQGNVLENLVNGDFVVIDQSGGSDGAYTISSFSLNGDDTDIRVDENIPSDAAPLGILRYNQVTESEMNDLAESKVEEALWKVVANGVKEQNYSFDPAVPPYTSPYRFIISGLGAELLGESEAFDFNTGLANEIANTSPANAEVTGSVANDGEYNIVSASADGPNIQVEVDPAPSSTTAGGELSISGSFALKVIDQTGQTFAVEGDLTSRLSAGMPVAITGSASNDGQYTILTLTFDGVDTIITVREDIPSDVVEGELTYTKSFPITRVTGTVFTIKGGADDQAVQDMVQFFQSTFFDHEGMHLVEHILLRPKVNELLFVDAVEDTLDETLAGNGTLSFTKSYPLLSADSATQTFVIAGDITADLTNGMTVSIRDTILLNGDYMISSFAFNSPNTEVVVAGTLGTDIPGPVEGATLSYTTQELITSVVAIDQKIIINGNIASSLDHEGILEISGSDGTTNDGRYLALGAEDVAGTTEIIIDKVERLVQDRLLSINLDEACECALEDPYTCIAHVILPYWPGRFINNDFRRFLEKTLRLEAPAHVFLNICWVSCSQMTEFELKYKAWLIENARQSIDKVKTSTALGELIACLERSRNVYPVGTLHDCDEDENLENSIILGNSALGEI